MILLDTNAWIWMNFNSPRLSRAARKAILEADTLSIATISLWEVGMLVSKGRINLPLPLLEWLVGACALSSLRILPITPEIAAASASLPIHGDPADRLIVATAMQSACPLVTADENIQKARAVETIW